MSFTKCLALVVVAGFTSLAMASAMVECGKSVTFDKGGTPTVKGSIFQISAEDDDFTGPASKKGGWSMTFNGQEYPPSKATSKVTANKDGFVSKIVVNLTIENIPAKLVVIQPYADKPKLIEYVQNKAGQFNKGAEWQCYSDQD